MTEDRPLPDSRDISQDIEGLADGQVRDLALAYLDLLRLMTESLEACTTGYGFFSWNGSGFTITGHPPDALVFLLQEQT